MKLIIDIPKESFELVKNGEEIDFIDAEHIISTIANGTPLKEALENQKSIIDELEAIKEEMDNKGWYNRHDKEQFAEIVDNHISELKGENK